MAEKRRDPSFGIPLLAGIVVLTGAFAFAAFASAFRCPACRAWEPGYVIAVTHTGSCEFCDGHDRVTLFNWFKAREWRSHAYRKE